MCGGRERRGRGEFFFQVEGGRGGGSWVFFCVFCFLVCFLWEEGRGVGYFRVFLVFSVVFTVLFYVFYNVFRGVFLSVCLRVCLSVF